MKKIYALFIGLLLTTLSFAQKVDYDGDTRWFWGLNLGGTWTKTDVPYRTDFGYGFIVGRQLNFNYGNTFSFDIRGRYLTGLWKGYATDTTNVSSNSLYNAYTTAGKPVYLNFGTRTHELSLELALHFNNLRANTGLDPYIFGGIGYSWYRAKGDLTNDGFIYEYDTLTNPSSYDVYSMTDKTYETDLNQSRAIGAFMPSLGFGLGYQFGKGFSMGIEHKTTFTLADNFDGHANASGKYKNDWYHYTSLYFRFHIRHHVYVPDTITRNPTNNNLTQQPVNTPPIVNFTNPSTPGTTVNSMYYVLRAKIQHVSSASNVVFKQNGNYVTNFAFNPSTQAFEATVTLAAGQNLFELTGTNNFGTASDQTSINYVRGSGNPPVVTYVNPSSNPTTVQQPSYNLSATVFNVANKDKITMTLNGTPVYFNYDVNSKVVTSTLTLVQGSNVVVTTGTNDFGTDSKSTTIIYNAAQIVQPPVVYFVNPNVNPYTTTTNTFGIQADVLNVADAQHVVFKQNGSVNGNFSFNPTTKRLTSNVILIPGQNVFEVIGTNTAGTASATTIIVYNRVAPKPPVVTITNPSVNPYETNNAVFNLNATVLNVTQKSQVKVTLNGANLTNFDYNSSTNGVTSLLNLVQGANVVVVTGTNSDGTDSKQTTIIYKPVQTVQPPVVTFTNPNVNPYSTTSSNYLVTASVLNVTSQSGVNVIVNGVNLTNFTFVNSIATFSLELQEGANSIIVTGTNVAGTDSKTQTILYRKPVAVQPPVVTFVNPNVNPTSVAVASYLVKARVQYVQAASQITLKINGAVSTNFTYTPSTEMMEFTTGLVNGSNIIEITGTNSAGSDTKSTTIVFRAPNPTQPPVVTITNPAANPHTQYTPVCPVSATILNVDNASQITVTFNGVPTSGFNYNTTTKVLDINLALSLGENNIVITATNSAGSASDTRKIFYKRDEVVPPPTVTFTSPSVPGTTVVVAPYTVKTKVMNVTGQSQITLKQDGQVVNTSYWSWDQLSYTLTFNTNLNPGNNAFEVIATNPAGTANAITSIIFKKPVECKKPVVGFVNPGASNMEVDNNLFEVRASITDITSANQVELKLNGNLQSAGSYNAGNYMKMLTLVEGQNVVEIKATNACGESTANTIIVYKPKAAPCIAPELTRVLPAQDNSTVEVSQVQVSATTLNISDVSQLQMTVNGTVVAANFDATTNTVTATVDLNPGTNVIMLKAGNACGRSVMNWTVTRNVCQAPVVTIVSSSLPAGTTTTSNEFNFTASVANVSSESEITVTHNGQATAFVFNAQTGMLSVNKNLLIGQNNFIVTATNACGTNKKNIGVFRQDMPNVQAPTIQITNPATTPYTTNLSGQTVNIATTGVTASSQVTVTVNGVQTTFSFKSSNGAISFNANWAVGANVIVATAVNAGGTASDTKTVIYTTPVTVNPPVIALTNPAACPATLTNGTTTVTGTVQNVTDASQVTILYNGTPVSFTSSVANNVLTFSFVVTITNASNNVPLVITAVNAGGTDTFTCAFNTAGNGNNGHGNNTDGNDESNPGQGGGGPNGQTGGTVDDENGNNGNGNGNRAGTTTKPKVVTPTKPGTRTTVPTTKPTTDTIKKPTTTPVVRPTSRP